MLNRRLDVLFIEGDASASSYQELGRVYSAIETPTWSLLLAQSCRSRGFGVGILDCNAERLSDREALAAIESANPRLACFVVYGQNPNSGTTNMEAPLRLCAKLRDQNPNIRTAFVGSHTSALPLEILCKKPVDFILQNEGTYALWNLLACLQSKNPDYAKIRGIGWKQDGNPVLNTPERAVPQEALDRDLPGYAWDLLPKKSAPLDLYRAHFWHARFDHGLRTPFAAIYTSLGCRFACDFCMINIVNRNDNSGGIDASDSRGMRYWSPDFILGQLEELSAMGVETLRISDEMFFLDKRYYAPLLQGILDRNLKFRMWCYSRVDTVRPAVLDLFRKAGMEWLALGVEAGNRLVRREVSKGSFEEVDIREVVAQTRASGLNVIANYIMGFPDDTMETMQQTLDLALELNTEMANIYPCMALPGSPLYNRALKEGWSLPDSFAGYGFLSYECQPLATKHVSATEVLRFRDQAWQTYFNRPEFLALVEKSFGLEQRKNVEAMASIKLHRKLLGDPDPGSS